MCIPDVNHRLENVVPGIGILQCVVGEHAAIPADVLDASISCIFKPIAGAFGDVQLAIGVISRTVLARLIMVAGPVHLAIILRDMEVDSPRTKGGCNLLVGNPEFFIGVILLE